MSEFSSNPQPVDILTGFSAALIRDGSYSHDGHYLAGNAALGQDSPVKYLLKDYHAWESTEYPAKPVANKVAQRLLLEAGTSIINVRLQAEGEPSTTTEYTVCRPSQVNPEYATGGLFYELDSTPPELGMPADPSAVTIVKSTYWSNSQSSCHNFVTEPLGDPQLMALYASLTKEQYPFSAQEVQYQFGLEEQYAGLQYHGEEPSVRFAHSAPQGPQVLRSITKSHWQIDFNLPEYINHLGVLSKLGVHVPSFRHQIGERALYAEVDYIQPTHVVPEDALRSPEALAKAAKLVELVSVYQNWAQTQGEWSEYRGRWALCDIHNLHQYVYGTNTTVAKPQEPQWWLTDIEPLTQNVRRFLDRSITSFREEVSTQTDKLATQPSLFT